MLEDPTRRWGEIIAITERYLWVVEEIPPGLAQRLPPSLTLGSSIVRPLSRPLYRQKSQLSSLELGLRELLSACIWDM